MVSLERSAIFSALVLGLSLTACAAPSAHQNFKDIMQGNVGRSLDDPYVYRNRYRAVNYVASKPLPNGNVEEEFRGGRGPTCRLFFEIDNQARKVVGWRYTGTEADCGIVP
jgi:hypothetical protein